MSAGTTVFVDWQVQVAFSRRALCTTKYMGSSCTDCLGEHASKPHTRCIAAVCKVGKQKQEMVDHVVSISPTVLIHVAPGLCRHGMHPQQFCRD
eukprot:4515027-Amphidinium_carterae.1